MYTMVKLSKAHARIITQWFPVFFQSLGDVMELLKNETLVGADPSFQYDKYYYRGEDQGPYNIVSTTGKHEAYILMENQARKHRHLKTLYNMIREGHLLRFCQNWTYKTSSDLHQFQEFCSKQPNTVGFPKPSDVDVDHDLSFLFCSLWGPSPHITSWCLTHDHEQNFEDLIQTALAFFLFPVHRDIEINLKASLLDKRIFPKPVSFENEITKFSFPCSVLSFTKDIGDYLSMIKEMSSAFHPRYLADPSLPIPATLLSVTVTEDAVIMELPSQHWYLVLRLLADREVDEKDRDGNTLLHIAADQGNLEAITLAVKADVNVRDRDGNTPLHRACRQGSKDTVELLLRHKADVNLKNKKGNTPLHTACSEGQQDTPELSMLRRSQSKWNDCDTPLYQTSSCKYRDIMELLLSHGADLNTRDEEGNTPLHIACSKGYPEKVGLLLRHKADVNVHDEDGDTPLHTACKEGSKDIVKLLLCNKADMNVKNKKGNTPLHEACP